MIKMAGHILFLLVLRKKINFMTINEKSYDKLMNIFDDYYKTGVMLTLFWPNGSILEGVSEVGSGETDSDIPEDSPEYPGYYSAFLDRVNTVHVDKRDLGDYNNRFHSIEIDMLNAPMIVEANNEIVWEKED